MCSDHKFALQLDHKELNTEVLFIRPVNLQQSVLKLQLGSATNQR